MCFDSISFISKVYDVRVFALILFETTVVFTSGWELLVLA